MYKVELPTRIELPRCLEVAMRRHHEQDAPVPHEYVEWHCCLAEADLKQQVKHHGWVVRKHHGILPGWRKSPDEVDWRSRHVAVSLPGADQVHDLRWHQDGYWEEITEGEPPRRFADMVLGVNTVEDQMAWFDRRYRGDDILLRQSNREDAA